MEQAIERLFGVAYLVIGLSHLVRPQIWVRWFERLKAQGDVGVFDIAFVHVPLGLLVVGFHNVWTWPAVIVTVCGWGLVVKSTLYFLEPRIAQRSLRRLGSDRAWEFRVAGVISLLLGAFASWLGWR